MSLARLMTPANDWHSWLPTLIVFAYLTASIYVFSLFIVQNCLGAIAGGRQPGADKPTPTTDARIPTTASPMKSEMSKRDTMTTTVYRAFL